MGLTEMEELKLKLLEDLCDFELGKDYLDMASKKKLRYGS